MDAAPLFALTHAWWTWKHDRVRDALEAFRARSLEERLADRGDPAATAIALFLMRLTHVRKHKLS